MGALSCQGSSLEDRLRHNPDQSSSPFPSIGPQTRTRPRAAAAGQASRSVPSAAIDRAWATARSASGRQASPRMCLILEGGSRETKRRVAMQTGCVATVGGKAGAGGHVWVAWEARPPLPPLLVSRRPAQLHSPSPLPSFPAQQTAQQRAE